MVPGMIKTKHLRQGDTVFSGEFFLPPACVNTLLLITIPPVVVILLQQGASCLLFSFYGAVHTRGFFVRLKARASIRGPCVMSYRYIWVQNVITASWRQLRPTKMSVKR